MLERVEETLPVIRKGVQFLRKSHIGCWRLDLSKNEGCHFVYNGEP